MGREERRDAAYRGLVDQRDAEVVQVVEVHDVGLHAVERLGEGLGDRRVVDLAQRVAEVEQHVRAVEDPDELDPVLLPLAHRVRAGAVDAADGGVEDRDVPAALGELLGQVAGDDRAAAGILEAVRGEDDLPAVRAAGRPERAVGGRGGGLAPARGQRAQPAGLEGGRPAPRGRAARPRPAAAPTSRAPGRGPRAASPAGAARGARRPRRAPRPGLPPSSSSRSAAGSGSRGRRACAGSGTAARRGARCRSRSCPARPGRSRRWSRRPGDGSWWTGPRCCWPAAPAGRSARAAGTRRSATGRPRGRARRSSAHRRGRRRSRGSGRTPPPAGRGGREGTRRRRRSGPRARRAPPARWRRRPGRCRCSARSGWCAGADGRGSDPGSRRVSGSEPLSMTSTSKSS